MPSLPHGFDEPGDVQDIRLVVDTIPTLAWSARPDGSAEFFNQRWLTIRVTVFTLSGRIEAEQVAQLKELFELHTDYRSR
jgi:hypothetical protein